MVRELMSSVTPEAVAFYRALYSPYFQRGLHTWFAMRRDEPCGPTPFIDQVDYCLDAIEPPSGNWI